MITASENSAQGGIMTNFNYRERVLNGDPFRVLISASPPPLDPNGLARAAAGAIQWIGVSGADTALDGPAAGGRS